MKTTLRILLTCVLVSSFATASAAKPKPTPEFVDGRGRVVLTWAEFIKITGFDPSAKGSGPQVLTIPWAEVEKLLGVKVNGVKGTTVDLPWKEFKTLLEWSIAQKASKPDIPPPTDCIFTSSRYEGTLADNEAKFNLNLNLNVLRKKGWKRIAILPRSVAIIKTTLPEGVFLQSQGKNYMLLTEKSGEMEISIEFSVLVNKMAGVNSVRFMCPAPCSSILDLAIARKDVDVKVRGAQSLVSKSNAAGTRVAAAISTGMPVSIAWERALPKVKPAPTKLYAETRTLVAVADEMLLCRETVSFSILHTAVRKLKLQVPKDVSVLTVTGRNVQDWRVESSGELSVVLGGEIIGSYMLQIVYERSGKNNVEAPVIRAIGVERERGFVGVVAVANVELAAGKVSGGTQIDVRQLPAEISAMTSQPILLAFRYVGKKLNIPLSIRKHGEIGVLVTIVDSATFTGMQLNDGRRMTKVIYSVRNNRNQFLRLKMPQGADIWSVSVGGKAVAPAKDDKGNVLVPLIRSVSHARELASFPVQMVYVETPKEIAPSEGKLHIDLPTCYVPAMQVMYSFYAPAEGQYTIGWWDKSGFSGPMRKVEQFTAMATSPKPSARPSSSVSRSNASRQAAQMQKQFQKRADARVRATGATPIRVRLPINGKLFKLEKILALPQDKLWFDVSYRNWEVAE